jgi:hypothetical protein
MKVFRKTFDKRVQEISKGKSPLILLGYYSEMYFRIRETKYNFLKCHTLLRERERVHQQMLFQNLMGVNLNQLITKNLKRGDLLELLAITIMAKCIELKKRYGIDG